jgi:hypothetical protein
MMKTAAQKAASRINGAKSKGPITPEGKRISSRNATKHGLLAETVVLETENKELFFAMVNELLEEHQPATPTEEMLVKTIASAQWRRDRIWNLQKAQFDRDIQSQPPATAPPQAAIQALNNPDTVRTHELLLRYEVALDREISRALLRLTQLQNRGTGLQPVHPNPTDSQQILRTGSPKPTSNQPHVVQTGSLRPIGNRPIKETPTTKQTQQPTENKKPSPTTRTLCDPERT